MTKNMKSTQTAKSCFAEATQDKTATACQKTPTVTVYSVSNATRTRWFKTLEGAQKCAERYHVTVKSHSDAATIEWAQKMGVKIASQGKPELPLHWRTREGESVVRREDYNALVNHAEGLAEALRWISNDCLSYNEAVTRARAALARWEAK